MAIAHPFIKGLSNLLKRLYSWQNQPGLRRVLLLAAIFFTVTLALAAHRYYNFYATYDHGLFNQLFWNSIHGNFFESSLSSSISNDSFVDGKLPYINYKHLGQHFVINFLLWMPLYALFPYPITLTILQVSLITASGLVLFFLARQYISPPLAVLITASFYFSNPIIGPTVDNFYELSQLPLCLFGVFLALEKRCWWLFWLLVALTLGIREETGITIFGLGIYLIFSRRYPRIGIALCLLSFTYVTVVTNVIMPLFSDDNSRLYLAPYFKKFVNKENPSTLELLWAIISQPQIIIQAVLTHFDRRIRYLLGQWLSLAFVPVISRYSWLLAGPYLLILLVQDNRDALSINTRYTLAVAPALFYGAILWWSQNSEKFKPFFRRFWIGCIAVSLIFTITSNPHRSLYFIMPYSVKPWVYASISDRWQHAAHLQAVMKLVPRDASLATSAYIVPHLSGRREIIRVPFMQFKNDAGEVTDVNYALLDMWQIKQHQLAAPVDRGRLRDMIPIVDRVLEKKTYGIIQIQDDIVLLQKGATSQPQLLSAWEKLREEILQINK